MGLKKFKKLEKFFKNFDMFGSNIRFNFKNQSTYRSFTGGFIYFIYLIFALAYTLYSFYRFADRADFNYTYNTDINAEASQINLTEKNIAFALGLIVDNPNLIIYDYLNITLNSIEINRDIYGTLKKNIRNIALVACEPKYFDNLDIKEFNNLNVKSRKCPLDKNLTIRGLYTENSFIYLEYVVSINSRYYNESPMIKQIFLENEIKSEILFKVNSFSINNYTNPISNYINSYANYLDFRFFKRMNFYISETNLIKDANFLLTDDKKFNINSIELADNYLSDVGENRLITKQNNFNILSKMYIRSSPLETTIKVTYTKLVTYLADLSGMFSLCTLCLMFFITYINDFKVEQAMIRNIFMFKNDIAYKNEDILNHIKDKFKNIQQNNITNEENKISFSNPPRRSILTNSKKEIPSLLSMDSKKDQNIINISDTNNSSLKTKSEFLKNNKITKKEDSLERQDKPNFGKRTRTFGKRFSVSKLKMKVRFNFCEMVRKLFCCCFLNKKMKFKEVLLDRAKQKLNYNMNIMTYFKKMQEIDILKYLLLNKYQISLLNFINKPSISFGNDKSMLNEIFDLKLDKKEIDMLDEAYNILNAKISNISETDTKLLSLFRDEIENLI